MDAGVGRGYDAFLQSMTGLIYSVLFGMYGQVPSDVLARGLLLGSLWLVNLPMLVAPRTLQRAREGSTGGDLFVMAILIALIGAFINLLIRSHRALPPGLVVWTGSIVGMTLFLTIVRAPLANGCRHSVTLSRQNLQRGT